MDTALFNISHSRKKNGARLTTSAILSFLCNYSCLKYALNIEFTLYFTKVYIFSHTNMHLTIINPAPKVLPDPKSAD